MADRFGPPAKKLVMSMFRSQTKAGRKKRLLPIAEQIMLSGAVEVPKWLEPMRMCAPAPALRISPS